MICNKCGKNLHDGVIVTGSLHSDNIYCSSCSLLCGGTLVLGCVDNGYFEPWDKINISFIQDE